jgi:1-aminocyclopropane-1-carboxylate deaminase/D-cysteine desulfhydrase-like pyridoxal-dependent ACC family enzyme
VQRELARAGKSIYLIPTGGSNALGALGYVRCARELREQSAALGFHAERVVHATSSGGTQAGLMIGMAEASAADSVLGINVYDPDHDAMEECVRSLARAVCDFGAAVDTDTLQPEIDHRHLGSGYGQPTSDTTEGIRQLAELEGILVDPVYSGKALGGLIQRIRGGEESMNSNVIFVHTGGVAVEYVYGKAFERPTG